MFILLGLFMAPGVLAEEIGQNDIAENIIKTAEKYIGTPYGGEFDCSGYVKKVFEENGIELPRSSASQYMHGEAIKKADLQKGDLVFFKTSGSGISHVGIYIGDNKFIHSSSSKGVIISKLNDPYYWGSRFVGAAKVF
ncbi:C40 family peptidase [Bacillus sp. P2(2020)]|uniref:C40 family peptidase n=2 Tax=Calidifontibacillus erzurumensis TaxID=2741433 RepID=A0A8J8GEM9_9BACI|nr:C40 family peptidase [Calidifontibacillus erzurumensis]